MTGFWNLWTAIVWAQWRSIRNRSVKDGRRPISIFLGVITSFRFLAFLFLAGMFAALPTRIPISFVRLYLPEVLFGLLAAWQFLPIVTVSTTLSLDLDKLKAYPLSARTLFGLTFLLDLLLSVDWMLVPCGIAIGLLRHSHVPPGMPLVIPILLIPLSSFTAIIIREIILRSGSRYRVRELIALLVLSVGILPQLLLRTSLGANLLPAWRFVAHMEGTPWEDLSHAALGKHMLPALFVDFLWVALAGMVAFLLVSRSLRSEQLPPAISERTFQRQDGSKRVRWLTEVLRQVPDPYAALIEKELRSLSRTPRFRVVFGMSCLFSIALILPFVLPGPTKSSFLHNQLAPSPNIYGVLLLAGLTMWNIFGFDRAAAALYFDTPRSLNAAMNAKNLVAALFVLFQAAFIMAVSAAFGLFGSVWLFLQSAGATATLTVFFLAIGNLLSVRAPRPIDGRQLLRHEGPAAGMQWWLLGSIGLAVALLAFAALWNWALNAAWPAVAIFALEFAIGCVVYRYATESAVQRAFEDRERILQSLAKNNGPLGS